MNQRIVRLPLLKNDKMARDIGDRKLAYVEVRTQSILAKSMKAVCVEFFYELGT